MYTDETGNAVITFALIAICVLIGGVYGGISTSMTGGNFWKGFLIGAVAGAFMGAFGAYASAFIASGIATGVTYKVVAGIAVAFGSGFVAGTGSSVAYQMIDGTSIDDVNWNSAGQSGLLWGTLNIIGSAVGAHGTMEGYSNFANNVLTGGTNIVVGAIGLGFDSIINSMQSIKDNNKNMDVTSLYIVRAIA